MAQTGKRRKVDEAPESLTAPTAVEDPPSFDAAGDNSTPPDESKPSKGLLPAPPNGKRASKDQLFDYLASLDPQKDWPHCTVYGWRLWPVIDRKLADPFAKTNIQIITKPEDGITEEEWVWRHGSGEYRIVVNDLNKPKGQTVMECRFTISDPEKPPVFEKAELVLGHPSNRSLVESLRARGELPMEGKPMGTQAADGSSALFAGIIDKLLRERSDGNNKKADSPDEKAVTKVLDMLSKANDKSIDMVLSQVKQQEPAAFLQMVTAIKELLPKAEASGGSDKEFFKMLLDQQQRNMDTVLKLIESNSKRGDGGDGLLDNLEKLVKVKELFGGDSGGGGHLKGWQAFAAEAMPYVPETLRQVGNIFTGIGTMANAFKGAPGRPMQPRQPDASAPPTIDAPNPAPGDPAKPAAAEPSQEEVMIQQMLGAIAGPLLTHLNNGSSGVDFADWFIGGYGVLAYRTVAGLGKDKLIAAIKGEPQLWAQIAPMETHFEEFVLEFLDWAPEDEVPDDEETPPIDLPPGGKRKRKGPQEVRPS